MGSTSVPLTLSPPPSPATQSHPHPSPAVSLPKPKAQTIRSRLSKLCQEGQPHLARQLFDTLPKPTTVLWNTIIIGFVCNNFPEEALSFYAQMKSSSPATVCDHYTYSSTLKACAETRRLDLGRALHCHVIRCSKSPSGIVHNSLLNMYATCSPPGTDLVRKAFDAMPRRNVVAWNTLIAWHARAGTRREAVSLFAAMMAARVRPSPVSFVNVFPAISGLSDRAAAIAIAIALYGLIVKMGSDYVGDPFVVSAAIFAFSDLGLVDLARSVFDWSAEQRNTEIWNTMIGCYVQNNLPVEAVDLFLAAVNSDETDLDEVTLLSALAAVSQLRRLGLARELHCYAVRNSRSSALDNAIVAMYSRCGSVATSFRAFRAMAERDLVSWNTMVTALVHNGLDGEAVTLVREMMENRGSEIDHVTVAALLSAASNLRDSSIGKQTHGYLVRRGLVFEGMDSYLSDMYAKSGHVNALRTIFERGSPRDRDLATWNSIVAGFTQNGLVGEAFDVFRLVMKEKLEPNSVTLASILPACTQSANLGLGKELHGFSIRRSLERNVFVGSALVDMYSKSGAVVLAENAFGGTAERNSVTYTNMILGYGQHGMGEKALSLFRSMGGSGVAPDPVTFVAVLSACSYCGLVEQGLEIFESMKRDHEIEPSIAHYCCVTDMLGRVGRVADAYEFVSGLGEEGDAVETWGSVLGACRVHGEFELGKAVAERLMGLDANGNETTGYRVLVSNMLAAEGDWERVGGLRKEMREKGLRKETGRSWIETCGSVSHFVSKDQRHHRSDEIYDMLGQLATEMRASGYRAQPSYGSDRLTDSDSDYD